jgi:hypothetical protein
MEDGKKFKCSECQKSYKRKSDLNRHIRSKREKFICAVCNHVFNRKDNFLTHQQRFHKSSPDHIHLKASPSTSQIGGSSRIAKRDSQKQSKNDSQDVENSDDNSREIVHALNGSVNSIKIYPRDVEKFDMLVFYSNVKNKVQNILVSSTPRRKGIKWYLVTRLEFSREKEGILETAKPHFRSITYAHLSAEDFNVHNLNEAFQKMFASKEEFIMKGSDWILSKVLYLEVCFTNYLPLKGGNYIAEPSELHVSKSLINVKNRDQKCFLYSVLAKLYPARHNPSRVSNYLQYTKELNMKGIQYPVKLLQIERFEKQNHVSINVFGYEDREIFPMRITKRKKASHVNLLYLKSKDQFHYCLIKNLNRFLFRTSGENRCYSRYYCPYCLHGFVKRHTLNKHIDFCMALGEQKIEMPTPGENDLLQFTETAKQLKVPFTIYADFETFVKPIQTCDLDPNSSHTVNLSEFEPCSFAYQVISTDARYTKKPVLYRGDDVVETFLNMILKEEEEIMKLLKRIEPMEASEEVEEQFEEATHCHICGSAFNSSLEKVRNHDHISGKLFGIAHRNCNLQLKQVEFIPVILHNLRGFDGHLIMQKLGLFKNKRLNVIANSNERYVTFSLGSLRFIDSFQFLSSSLDTLVQNLKSNGDKHFKNFSRKFKTDREKSLLLRKGVYPYSFVTDASKFMSAQLPSKSAFYNSLSKTDISNEEYEYAQRVWDEMNMETMGDYHDLYLMCDVLLLADVFERFREVSMESFDLDPAQYFTLAGMCWSACLKMTNVQLELLTDIDQYQMIERGIRGGVAMMTTRYAEANNPYIPETFDENKPREYLGYYDMNNLYGGAMLEPLPVGDFCWLTNDEISELNIMGMDKNCDIGYILEVTLNYPDKLHDHHTDLPLAPEPVTVYVDDLSPYCKEQYQNINKKRKGVVSKKLIPTLRKKEKYVLHYRNLQFYLQEGLELKEIHRVIRFRQEAWLKPYIDYNTNMRRQAKSDFEVKLYKDYNNIVFG